MKARGSCAEDPPAAVDQLGGRDGGGEAALEAGGEPLVEGERGEVLEAEGAGGEGVVAHLGVAVEGEVVGDQVEAGLDQRRHPPVLDAGQRIGGAAPEDAVVDQHRVGARHGRPGEQLGARGDAGDDLADLAPPLDLEAVGAVVGSLGGLEVGVEVADEFVAKHDRITPSLPRPLSHGRLGSGRLPQDRTLGAAVGTHHGPIRDRASYVSQSTVARDDGEHYHCTGRARARAGELSSRHAVKPRDPLARRLWRLALN